MTEKKTEIKFGVGSFTCYECGTQYTIAEKSVVMILDEKGEAQNICKFCVKKLDPKNYERLYHPRYGQAEGTKPTGRRCLCSPIERDRKQRVA